MTHFETGHPRLEGFDQYYHDTIASELEQLERQRRVAKQKALPLAGIVAIVSLLLIGNWLLFPTGLGQPTRIVLTIVGALVLGIGLWLVFREMRQIAARAREHLVSGVFRFFGLHLRRSAEGFPFGRFVDNALVPSHDRRSLEDHVTGEHEDVRLELCEAHLEERYTTTDSKGRSQTRYRTVFRGLLMQFSFPKEFAGRTIISRDSGMIGNFFGRLGGGRGERVELESPDFERVYEVYSDDQVEARYLLTPTFMERLLELDQLVEGTPQLAFEGDRLSIAASSREDRFEGGSMFSDLSSPRHTRELLRELSIVFDVIETLQLQLKTRA